MKTLREHFEAWQAELEGPAEMRTLAASAFLVGVCGALAALKKGQTDLQVMTDMVTLLAEVDEQYEAQLRAIAELN